MRSTGKVPGKNVFEKKLNKKKEKARKYLKHAYLRCTFKYPSWANLCGPGLDCPAWSYVLISGCFYLNLYPLQSGKTANVILKKSLKIKSYSS